MKKGVVYANKSIKGEEENVGTCEMVISFQERGEMLETTKSVLSEKKRKEPRRPGF